MGSFVYNGSRYLDVADDTLAYLEAVVSAKFGLAQAFQFTWKHAPGTGEGHTTLWLTPAVPLRYEYTGRRLRHLDPDKLEALMNQTHTPAGLRLDLDASGRAHFDVGPG